MKAKEYEKQEAVLKAAFCFSDPAKGSRREPGLIQQDMEAANESAIDTEHIG